MRDMRDFVDSMFLYKNEKFLSKLKWAVFTDYSGKTTPFQA
jgi:hypothetical protein